MELLVLIPALLVFLYSLYRLTKDDYVFIRKGISLEQSFDIAFISLWISLFFSRLLHVLFNQKEGTNFFIQFLSINDGGFSLSGAIIGGLIALFFIGKYKRVPLGRLSDFLSLSFLYAIPVGFLASALVVNRSELLSVLMNVVLYFLLMIFFVQFLYPRLMSRTLKEGTLAILFLMSFSLISLLTALLTSFRDLHTYINIYNIITFCLFLFSIVLFIKENPFSKNRRNAQR